MPWGARTNAVMLYSTSFLFVQIGFHHFKPHASANSVCIAFYLFAVTQ
jgi:hypothetical protein